MNFDGELVDLTVSQALIDIRGGGFDSVLLVGGSPIAFNWSDCEGSVAQYMVRAGATNFEDRLRTLRHALAGNLKSNAPLSLQIAPILELLVPGRYRLQYRSNCLDCQLVEYKSSWSPSADYDQFYPFGSVFVFTQSTDTLDEHCVAQYVQAIQGGQRPIAITGTVEDGWCEFVLDGHHKLQAYKTARISPAIISICRVEAPRLSPHSFEQYFGSQHPMGARYRVVKSERDA